MAIIVDKEAKRQSIALSCRALLLQNGIHNLTIAQIARTAGIGKGTVYEYFHNKEDIVFEIITLFIAEHEQKFLERIAEAGSAKEKIYHFLTLLYDDDETRKHLSLYREFIAISLLDNTPEIREFSRNCQQRFTAILEAVFDEAIANSEIAPRSRELIPALHFFSKGIVTDTEVLGIDPDEEIARFVEALFSLIEEKQPNTIQGESL